MAMQLAKRDFALLFRLIAMAQIGVPLTIETAVAAPAVQLPKFRDIEPPGAARPGAPVSSSTPPTPKSADPMAVSAQAYAAFAQQFQTLAQGQSTIDGSLFRLCFFFFVCSAIHPQAPLQGTCSCVQSSRPRC